MEHHHMGVRKRTLPCQNLPAMKGRAKGKVRMLKASSDVSVHTMQLTSLETEVMLTVNDQCNI